MYVLAANKNKITLVTTFGKISYMYAGPLSDLRDHAII
jgi:hypothetical protein